MSDTPRTANIYLGSPFYSDDERKRVDIAKAYLAQNPTVERVFFPFDQNFTDPNETAEEAKGKRSMLWREATYQNDLNNIVTATVGVFLYDMDMIDDGSAFEIGFMRALHKPVVLVPFTKHPEKEKQMNLMLANGVTTLIDGTTNFEALKTFDFNDVPANPVTGYVIL